MAESIHHTTIVLSDVIDHYKTFNKIMYVWSKLLHVKYWKRILW